MIFRGYKPPLKLLFGLFLFLAGITLSVQAAQPVDINQANAEELADALHGVGPKKALAIIQYRKIHGPFKKVADLINVKGIGPKTMEKNKHRMRVGKDILIQETSKGMP